MLTDNYKLHQLSLISTQTFLTIHFRLEILLFSTNQLKISSKNICYLQI